MTRQRTFKRLVRSRMAKTGERYAAARAALLAAEESKATEGPALSMSDDAIRRKTGRGWEEWFDLLDEWGGAERPRSELVRWVGEEHGIQGWGAQAVTVTYERARGLRAVGEHPDGFAITASKTVAVPVDRLYEAFVDQSLRRRWLPGGELRERTASRPRSARFDWGDGKTRVNVGFTAKGEAKSAVALQHERLADAAEAERMKALWRDRVTALKEMLEQVAAIRQAVTVRSDPERAFDLFTEHMGTWWPVAAYSRTVNEFEDEDVEVVRLEFQARMGGSILEHVSDGRVLPWAEVMAWHPPHSVVMAWRPHSKPEPPTEVEVTFTARDGGTLVELEHRGWDLVSQEFRDALYETYARGWVMTLGRFTSQAERDIG